MSELELARTTQIDQNVTQFVTLIQELLSVLIFIALEYWNQGAEFKSWQEFDFDLIISERMGKEFFSFNFLSTINSFIQNISTSFMGFEAFREAAATSN